MSKVCVVLAVHGLGHMYHIMSGFGVIVNCLRIGHTRLTNYCLLLGENRPECHTCQSPVTVKHILIVCTSVHVKIFWC